jgi:DNA-binding NarL/FixJ family response regulator
MISEDKVNILLVDDQPSKLLTYEVILQSLGDNLIKATSGKDALEQLLKNEIAVILVDSPWWASPWGCWCSSTSETVGRRAAHTCCRSWPQSEVRTASSSMGSTGLGM